MKSAITFLAVTVLSTTIMNVGYAQEVQTKQVGDYHLSLYPDFQGEVLDLEAYSKQPEKNVFFGVTCSRMSPFPAATVILQEDDIISETPRFMTATYRVDGKPGSVPLQAILQANLSADLYLNKVRLEVDPNKIPKRMDKMKQAYNQLLNDLETGKTLDVTLQHHRLGNHHYQFSLQGLKQILEPYQDICR